MFPSQQGVETDDLEYWAVRTFCNICPYIRECEAQYQLFDKMFDQPPYGVWAGKTTKERRK
jgi:hypothetical protein